MKLIKSKITHKAEVYFYLNENKKYVVSVLDNDSMSMLEEFFENAEEAQKCFKKCVKEFA
jgi:hypothetical protein